mgnify:CR=1 FL=1
MVKADKQLFEWINGLVSRSGIVDELGKFLASDFFLPVLIALGTLGMWFAGKSFLDRLRNQMGFIYAAGGAGVANLIVRILNNQFDRPRPFVAMEDVKVLLYMPTDPSLPSNAATYAFAMATGVWLTNRRWGMVIGVAALLFSLARVYAGMHFPLDVVTGALVGVLTTYTFSKLLGMLQPILNLAFRMLRTLFLA